MAMLATREGLGQQGWLWRLAGLAVDKQISSVVVATGVGWRPPGYCCGFRGRLRTTKLASFGL